VYSDLTMLWYTIYCLQDSGTNNCHGSLAKALVLKVLYITGKAVTKTKWKLIELFIFCEINYSI